MSQDLAHSATDNPDSTNRPVERGWRNLIGEGAPRAIVFGTLSLLLSLLVWQVMSTFVFNPFLIPPPLEVVRAAVPMIANGEIFSDVAISMTRIVVGFVTGSFAGIAIGVLLGRIRILNDLFDPIIELMRYLSPTAMIPTP